MISKHFKPVEKANIKWDAGMILFEFDALREPESSYFPLVEGHLKSLGIEFSRVEPKMLWRGKIHPDLYIANRLDAVPEGWHGTSIAVPLKDKKLLADNLTVEAVSKRNHGEEFHNAFIEPMCQKILGIPTAAIVARYHRSAWLPLYWQETLKDRKSLDTRFWYPKCGYAGIVAEKLGVGESKNNQPLDRVEIKIAFVLAKPLKDFQVLFVVDPSTIYRVTDMDACAGTNPAYHRFIVEYREHTKDVTEDAQRMHLFYSVQYSTVMSVFIPSPTLANVRRGWRPAKNMNEQIYEGMNAALSA